MEVKISPSMMCADSSNLLREVRVLEKAGVDFLHFDVMDGHFVSNLAFGPQVVEKLGSKTSLMFEMHLMVERPEKFIEGFLLRDGDLITVHSEVLDNNKHAECQKLVEDLGGKMGLAIKVDTPLEQAEKFFGGKDEILLMAHEVGFSTGKLDERVYEKIARLKKMLVYSGSNADVSVDGGVTSKTAPLLVNNGANALVCGSGIFNSKGSVKENVRQIRDRMRAGASEA